MTVRITVTQDAEVTCRGGYRFTKSGDKPGGVLLHPSSRDNPLKPPAPIWLPGNLEEAEEFITAYRVAVERHLERKEETDL